MATKPVSGVLSNSKLFVATWAIAAGEDGDPVEIPAHYTDVTVQVKRTGTTDTLTFQGSNDGTNYNDLYAKLQNAASGKNDPLSGLTSTLLGVLSVPRFIKPVPSGATDSFAVTLVARQRG